MGYFIAMTHPETPLEIIHQNICVYTTWYPNTLGELVVGMADSVMQLDEPVALAFAERLQATLADNPDRGAVGLAQASRLQLLKEIVIDTHEESPVDPELQFGALALLGALSLGYDRHYQPDETTRTPQEKALHVHGAIAREILHDIQLVTADGQSPRVHDFAQSTLAIEMTADHAFTTELMHAELAKPLETEVVNSIAEPTEAAAAIVIVYESDKGIIGQPEAVSVKDVELNKDIVGLMTWLDGDILDEANLELRQVNTAGERKAYLLDLSQRHARLKETMQNIDTSSIPQLKEQFYNRLGVAIVAHTINPGAVKRQHSAGVPLYCSVGMGSADVLTRGYFTLAGKYADGLPVYALMAGIRGKKDQRTALKIIGGKSYRRTGV
jgi:hypothetical protein